MLPARITFDEAWQLRRRLGQLTGSWARARCGPWSAWAGTSSPRVGPDLADGVPAFIVAGPAKSGRSTILATMARSFLAAGTQVILVTPRPSPLRALAAQPGVVAAFEGPELGAAEFAAAVGSFTGPGVVIIDDAELLRDCEAEAELSKMISFGADQQSGPGHRGRPRGAQHGFRRLARGSPAGPARLP